MLEKNDLVIMSRLRTDARESLTRMSRKTSIPVTTIHKKVKGFEKNLIKKYVALLDFTNIGYNTRAMIVLRAKKELKDNLKEFLLDNRSVNSVYKINNGFDFMIEVIFKEIGEVEFFVEQIENDFKVDKKEIYYIINEINRESFLSRHEYVKLIGEAKWTEKYKTYEKVCQTKFLEKIHCLKTQYN